MVIDLLVIMVGFWSLCTHTGMFLFFSPWVSLLLSPSMLTTKITQCSTFNHISPCLLSARLCQNVLGSIVAHFVFLKCVLKGKWWGETWAVNAIMGTYFLVPFLYLLVCVLLWIQMITMISNDVFGTYCSKTSIQHFLFCRSRWVVLSSCRRLNTLVHFIFMFMKKASCHNIAFTASGLFLWEIRPHYTTVNIYDLAAGTISYVVFHLVNR